MVIVIGDWRGIALGGLAALLFGIVAVVWPDITVTALVLIFGAYVLVDGASVLAAGLRGERNEPTAHRHRGFIAVKLERRPLLPSAVLMASGGVPPGGNQGRLGLVQGHEVLGVAIAHSIGEQLVQFLGLVAGRAGRRLDGLITRPRGFDSYFRYCARSPLTRR